ncbi:MAG: PAS domain S-box protein [Pyrinomonadaceae bacterium]|nr:PAS domain S-box protein [Pyrinomonadaceae bacterium]
MSGLLRGMTKDGSERVWAYRNVRFEEAGKPAYVLGHAVDITERVRAEEALRETEARLRTVIANSPIVLFALDGEGVFTLSEGKGLE